MHVRSNEGLITKKIPYEISKSCDFAKDFRISGKISRFQERLQDFMEISRLQLRFKISLKISGFPETFQDFRKDFKISWRFQDFLLLHTVNINRRLSVTNLSSENNFASAPPTQETADVSSPEEEQEKGPLVVIPYVAGMSEDIRRVCRKFNIRVVFKSGQTLRSMLTKVKDTLPPGKQSNVVYRIPCSCGQVYIGETKRRLET